MYLLLRISFYILNLLYILSYRILRFIYRKKLPDIPPISDSLLTVSAAALAEKIRQKEITSYEIVHAYIERIREVNPFINAAVDDRFDAALIEAKKCDEQIKTGKVDVKNLEKSKPLYGVPFTVKECIAVKGLSHTGCTLSRKGIKATNDAFAVDSLRNAGAIPLCVTNQPEMCANFHSLNYIYGGTLNPYDRRYTSGGSSGGEGALLGAGATLIGLGSDIGGSIRVPAQYNGIFGHKPTAGIISISGHYPIVDTEKFLKYMTVGPMTRYADDLSLAMRILTSKCDRNLRMDVPVDLKKLKVYYRESLDDTFGILPMRSDIKQCVLKAADHFRQSGIHTEKLPIELPTTLVEIVIASLLNMAEGIDLMIVKDPKEKKCAILEMVKALFNLSEYTKSLIFFAILLEWNLPFMNFRKKMLSYVKQGEEIQQKLMDLLGEDGVFIFPVFRTPAPFPHIIILHELQCSLVYSALANIFGFPSVFIPMGLNSEKLPIGVQVIAGPYQDRLCMAVAKEMETAFGGWVPPSISIED